MVIEIVIFLAGFVTGGVYMWFQANKAIERAFDDYNKEHDLD